MMRKTACLLIFMFISLITVNTYPQETHKAPENSNSIREEPHIRILLQKLSLSEKQKKMIKKHFQEIEKEIIPLKNMIDELRYQNILILKEPQLDTKKLEENNKKISELMREIYLKRQSCFTKILCILDENQMKTLASEIEKLHMKHMKRMHMKMMKPEENKSE